MTAPELVPKKGRGEAEHGAEHDDVSRPDLERRAHPATRRTVRRWEFGVFIRKIVNGWLVYYKKFPPGSGSDASEPQVRRLALESSQSGGGGDLDGSVTTYSTAGKGSGDSGPVGETRVEAGFFLSSTTDTSTESDDESDAS